MLISVYSLFIEALTETTRFLKTIVQFIKHVKKKKKGNRIPLNEKKRIPQGIESKIFLACVQEGWEKIFLKSAFH